MFLRPRAPHCTAALTFVLLGLAQAATPAGVHQGTVGPYPVVVQLYPDGTGKYAYLSKGFTLELTVQTTKTGLKLTEHVWNLDQGKEQTTGTFALVPGGTGSAKGWKGTWKDGSGKRSLQVVLQQVPINAPLKLPPSPGLQKLQKTDPYTFVLFNHPWKTLKNGWVQEPLSGVRYPRVQGNPRLSGGLQDLQLAEATQALECLGAPSIAGSTNEWDPQLKVTLQTAKLYSFKVDTYSYCGGAHPNVDLSGHTLDVQTGQEIPLKQLWPGLTPKKQFELYLQKYRQQDREDRAECLDAIAQNDPTTSPFSWHLDREGLVLFPNFLPHVVIACGDELSFSLDELKAWEAKNSPHLKSLR